MPQKGPVELEGVHLLTNTTIFYYGTNFEIPIKISAFPYSMPRLISFVHGTANSFFSRFQCFFYDEYYSYWNVEECLSVLQDLSKAPSIWLDSCTQYTKQKYNGCCWLYLVLKPNCSMKHGLKSPSDYTWQTRSHRRSQDLSWVPRSIY